MKHPHPGLCLALTAVVTSLPALAQEPAFTLTPSADHQQLGSNYVALGDLDGDGTVDLAVSDPSFRSGGFLSVGAVHLVSGADGSTLRRHQGHIAANQYFGLSLAALDADGDGATDLAVGTPGQSGPGGYGAGAVWIFSGANGSVLSTFTGPAASQFGSTLANAGDQNGDGLDDLLVGAPNANGSRGEVHVVSASDGVNLGVIGTTAFFSSFGTGLATVSDLDGDGRREFVVAAPGFRSGSYAVGKVAIYRSSDRSVVVERTAAGSSDRFGESLAGVPDTDGDGVTDLMIGSYSGGSAFVVSGANLATVVDLSVPGLPANQRVHVGGSLDFDADGTRDWLIGSPGLAPLATGRAGGIRVISGANGQVLLERLATAALTNLGLNPRVLPGLGMAAGESSLRDPLTGGRGFAHVWQVAETVPDADGDGIPDDIDAVPDSNLDPTVTFLGVDSGVTNTLDTSGMSLADRFVALGTPADYDSPGRYQSAAARLASELADQGIITPGEAGKLTSAAAKAKGGRR
jgi:hypothetical protein